MSCSEVKDKRVRLARPEDYFEMLAAVLLCSTPSNFHDLLQAGDAMALKEKMMDMGFSSKFVIDRVAGLLDTVKKEHLMMLLDVACRNHEYFLDNYEPEPCPKFSSAVALIAELRAMDAGLILAKERVELLLSQQAAAEGEGESGEAGSSGEEA